MFDKLQAYFAGKIHITDSQLELMKPLFLPRRMKKGDFLQNAGEVAQYGAFVASGCLRSYVIDDKGKEHIIQFAPENWWLSDINSIRNNTPSLFFMDAVEPTDALLIDRASFEKMLMLVPDVAKSFQMGLMNQAAAKNQRIISSLTATAEEKYLDFIKTYPSLARRVPQHMIASYLGLTPETISRVRKQLQKK